MTTSRTFELLALVGCASSFVLRNDAQLNTTTEPSEPTVVEVVTVSVQTSTWRPKVHGESSAGTWATTAIGSDSNVRLEPTSIVSHATPPLTVTGSEQKQSSGPPDIGSAIEIFEPFPTTDNEKPMPTAQLTVHWEQSAPAWNDETSTVHIVNPATDYGVSSSAAAHWESSADGWADDRNQAASTRYVPIEVTDNSWTEKIKPPQVTGLGTPVDRQPQVTTVPNKIITDFAPPPPVTYVGVTLVPTAITRQRTVTAPDGSLTTTDKVEFHVAVGSSTLSIGAPITINDVVVRLTTNGAGSTVLYAGDLTTTLPEPAAGEMRTVAAPSRVSVATSVINGTTKYLLAGQTLAPGQPVTIGDTPISVDVDGDKTVLMVGERTTTLSAGNADLQTITDWGSVGTQGTVTDTGSASAEPTSARSGSSQQTNMDAALAYCIMGMAMLMVIS